MKSPSAKGGFCLVAAALFYSHAVCSAQPGDSGLLQLKHAILANYAAGVSAGYQNSLTAVKELQNSVNLLLTQPSEQSLQAARKAWLSAHQSYSLTEAYRFYNGPIDHVEALVNSWPIDPSYIDSVTTAPAAGIINAVSNFPALSRELVIALNARDGKQNISTGFHAIEFLLWGQPPGGCGAGKRSWRDYTPAAANSERRRDYLRIVTDLLVENLQSVTAAWLDGSARNYRAQFLAMDPDAALANILMGMGALSGPELSGERLTTAYETKERTEQQDCFSDSTCDDLVADAIGIQNVFLGHYTGTDGHKIEGPGIRDLLTRLNPDFASKLAEQVEAAVASVRSIPPPFDQAILGTSASSNRIAMKIAIVALQSQSDLIAQGAKVLSIQLKL